MRNSKAWRAAVLVAASLAAGTAAAQGWDDGPGPDRRGPGFQAPVASQLGLTAEQRATIRKIRHRYVDGALGEKMEAMHEARENLRAAIHDPAKTDRQVQDAVSAVALLEEQIAVERHHMAGEIQGVLTAEQRQKAAELRQERRDLRPEPPPPPPDDF